MSLAAQKSREEINQKPGNNSGFTIYAFDNADEAGQNISGIIKQRDVVLIKGSRAMGMERIIERIRE